MASHSIASRIAASTFTLPVSLVIGLILWLVTSWGVSLWWQLPMAALATYTLMEMNNRNALIRVRSRMMSALFWLGLPLVTSTCLLPMLLVAVATYTLFCTYDRREPVLHVFHCFTALGVSAVLCHPLVVLIPAFLLYLIIYMRVWSARVLSAACLGLALAAVGMAIYLAADAVLAAEGTWHDAALAAVAAWRDVECPTWHVPSTADYTPSAAWLVPAALGLVAAWCYVRQSYDDKIQVRMMNYVLVCQWMIAQALILGVPSRTDTLLPVAWFNTAPLVAHQMAVARTRWTTLWLTAVVALNAVLLLI